MIWLTKRIRTKIMLNALKAFDINEEILDVGCGDGYFVRKAKEKGYKIKGVDPEYNKIDYLKMKRTKAKIITALALLWHIDIEKFFKKSKELGIEKIIILQGFSELEPITRAYSIGHKHKTIKSKELKEIAKRNGYNQKLKIDILAWELIFYERGN